MLEEDKIAIEQCLYAINHIFEYTEHIQSIEDLINDSRTYDAVQMNFIIFGQSASKLSDNLKKQLSHIDWRAIRGFRNFVAHDYFGVDENIVWSAIKFHLPQLKVDLEKLIEDSK